MRSGMASMGAVDVSSQGNHVAGSCNECRLANVAWRPGACVRGWPQKAQTRWYERSGAGWWTRIRASAMQVRIRGATLPLTQQSRSQVTMDALVQSTPWPDPPWACACNPDVSTCLTPRTRMAAFFALVTSF